MVFIHETLLDLIEGKENNTGHFVLSSRDIEAISDMLKTLEAICFVAVIFQIFLLSIIVMISLPKGGF